MITTPFTFFSTVEAILYLDAKPVFVDIDPMTYNIDAAGIEKKITGKTKAILPVHLFGCPVDIDKILDIAGRHGLKIVEDCAQSMGASSGSRKTGSFGDTGAFSFYPSKNLGAYGDGGLITTGSDDIAKEVRLLRNHGSAGGYIHTSIGFNSRLDELQAAILLVKLKRLDAYNKKEDRRRPFTTAFFPAPRISDARPPGKAGICGMCFTSILSGTRDGTQSRRNSARKGYPQWSITRSLCIFSPR